MEDSRAQNRVRFLFCCFFTGTSALVPQLHDSPSVISFFPRSLPDVRRRDACLPPASAANASRSDPPREDHNHKALEVRPEIVGGSTDTATALVTVEKPGSYSWWIGVQGHRSGGASYTVQARNVRPCPHDCSGGGECATATGRCFCEEGVRGVDCSKRVTTASSRINFGETVLARTSPGGGWRYHELQVRTRHAWGLRRHAAQRIPRTVPIGINCRKLRDVGIRVSCFMF